MRKKGFTLVELLAVIVVLAIIAVIATPLILNVIENSEKGTFKSSTYGVIESAELYAIMNTDDFKESEEIIFECNGTSCRNENGYSLDIKGEIPKAGRVIIAKDNISVDLLSNGKYCALGTKEKLDIQKDCEKLDITEAIIDDTKLTITSTSSKVIVNIAEDFAIDKESGIKEYKIVLVSDDKTEEKKLSNIGTLEFTGLTNNKEYKVKVIVVNGNDMETTTSEKTVTTKNINAPTCTVSPTGWAQSKKVTCTYEDNYTNEYSIDGGKTWNTYSSAVTFTSNGTLIARVTDGTNYVSSSTYTVSQIDTTAPTEATFTYTKTSKSITVTASGTDSESGIIRYQFSNDDGSNWTSVQESNIYTFNDLTSGTYKVKVRVYNGTYVNVTSGNFKDSDSQDVKTTTIATPTCSVSPTGWTTSKSVTCTYDSGYTNEYSLDGGSTWKPYSSAVTFTSNGTLIARVNDGKNYVSSSSYTVSQIDTTAPSLTLGTASSSSKSVTVPITASDSESNIKSTTCVYGTSTSYGSTGTISGNNCVMSNLEHGKTYYYKVVTTNNAGTSTTKTGSKATTTISTPTCSTSPTGWAQSKTVTCTYPSGYTNQYSTDGGSTWKTYSSAVTFTSNGTLIARVNDGKNYVSSSSYTISQIDTTAPNLTLGTASSSSKSITVPITTSDSESGIKSTTCVYGTSTSYGSTGTISGNNCVMSNLSHGKTYYYKIVTTNNAGTSTTKTGSKATTTIATPTCSVSPDGYTSGNKTVTCTYPSGYTNQYSLDGGSTWKTYSSAVTFTANGTLIARVNDGTNYVSSSSYTVTGIDKVSPTVTLGSVTSDTTSITIPYTMSDDYWIYDKTCMYSTSNGSYTTYATWETSGSTTQCVIPNLTPNTTYYYQVCGLDYVGHKTCKTGSKTTARRVLKILDAGPTYMTGATTSNVSTFNSWAYFIGEGYSNTGSISISNVDLRGVDYIEITSGGYDAQTINITDSSTGNVIISVPFSNTSSSGSDWYSSTLTKDISSLNNIYNIKITSNVGYKYTYLYKIYIYYKH